ncbi:hypothetical protein J6590_084689 [Homalodisca vitripennis]|nr:hypothetical protein J6590_084689 [Homalodisca vitripennis]
MPLLKRRIKHDRNKQNHQSPPQAPKQQASNPPPEECTVLNHLISAGRALQRRQSSTLKDLLKIVDRWIGIDSSVNGSPSCRSFTNIREKVVMIGQLNRVFGFDDLGC